MEKLLPMAMLACLALSPARVSAALPATSHVEPSADFKEKLALGESYRDRGSYVLAAKEFEAVLAQAEKQAIG